MNFDELSKSGYTLFKSNINKSLIKECLSLNINNAGIANGIIDTNIRNDKTCWLSKEQGIQISDYIHNAENIMKELNRCFYLGLKEFDCHFSLFDAGSFFKKHIDNKQGTNKRKITYITYLNENWSEKDGGLLNITNGPCVIPEFGTSVIFDSNDIEHEVTISHKARMAISGWFS